MLKNILKKPSVDKKVKSNVLADLRRVLATGRRVALLHQGQLIGMAVVVAIEDHRLLFEALDPIDELLTASVVGNIEQGVPWDFALNELQAVKEGDDTYLQCAIPGRIDINSRRGNFRVSTPNSAQIELHFHFEGTDYVAQILDLSCTGAQIRVEDLTEFPLEIDQVSNQAELKLGEDSSVVLDFQLRWTQDSDKSLRAGIKFSDLESVDSDRIHHMVNEIEREIIRKLKSLD